MSYYASLPAMGGMAVTQIAGYLPSSMPMNMSIYGMTTLPRMPMSMSLPALSSLTSPAILTRATGLVPRSQRRTPESEGSRSSLSPPPYYGSASLDTEPDTEKDDEYLKELQVEKEKLELNPEESLTKAHTLKLLEQEMGRINNGGSRLCESSYIKYVDVYRERPIRLMVRVQVPVREHPKFNFVGKLLGPKGNSMKRLQEETMTKMAVLGKGSMRNKQKEEDLRLSLDPKYQHLHEDLYVEVTAFAPPAEAHARIAFALTEVRKYLIPDSNDDIRQEQIREMELLTVGGDQKLPVSPMCLQTSPINALGQQLVLSLGPTPVLNGSYQLSSPYPSSNVPVQSPTITGLPTFYGEENKPSMDSSQTSQSPHGSSVEGGTARNNLKVLNVGKKTTRHLTSPYSRIQ